MTDNTLRRKGAYGPNRLFLLDSLVVENEGEFTTFGSRAAAERYLNSGLRRALELTITLTLLVIAAPVMCLVALAVWISSPGPILFRQLRHGQGMAMFELIKFRSMYWSGEPDPLVVQAMRQDPRVTPVGRILRCTSLDELPQLISVIKGEMSLIGPRPHAIEHDFYYRDLVPHYCDRLRARPGITGLAQVSGARGATPRLEDMKRRIELDLLYLQRASLRLDCRIFLKTIKEVFVSTAAF